MKTVTHIQEELSDSNVNRLREVGQAYTHVHCAINDRLTAIEESIRKMREANKEKVNETSDIPIASQDVVAGEKWRLDVMGRSDNVKRDYKLTSQIKFEHVMDFFKSELRARDLFHYRREHYL